MRHDDGAAGAVTDEPVQIGGDGIVRAGVLSRVAAPRLAVVINAATGVPAAFYRPFARWLALEKQAAVLTWDYRDFGESGSPYRSGATMTDWAIADPVAARGALRARVPDVPLWVIGHSLGGMALGFQPGIEAADRLITVAAGHGHVSAHPWPMQARVRLMWYLLGPLATALLGYFPASRFGLGKDLPRGVFWQWRRWLLDRGALPADPALGGLRRPGYGGPMTLIALDDDTMVPPACVRKMAAWHPAAQIEQRLLRAVDFGLPALGHVTPFSARNAACWPALIA